MPRDRNPPEVNASSMADIAFLLLIFFLVTTTIASDKGLPITLPPKRTDETDQMRVNERNVHTILINSQDKLLVEGDPMELGNLKASVKRFLANNGKDLDMSESPQKAVVSIKADRGTGYETYIQVLDQIKAGYHELRAQYLGITLEEYLALKYDGDDKVQEDVEKYERAKAAFPLQISEAEPTTAGGN